MNHIILFLAKPGRIVTLIKSKTIRILKQRTGFHANVEAFTAELNRRVRRLEPRNPYLYLRRLRQGNALMLEVNKEEKNQ